MKISLFEKDANTVAMPAGHVIFRHGDAADCMYAVVDGTVDLVIHGTIVESVEAGGVFGEMALIEQQNRIADAVVTRDAKLVAINRQRFLFLVQQHPFFALQLMEVMAGRLRKMDERL